MQDIKDGRLGPAFLPPSFLFKDYIQKLFQKTLTLPLRGIFSFLNFKYFFPIFFVQGPDNWGGQDVFRN